MVKVIIYLEVVSKMVLKRLIKEKLSGTKKCPFYMTKEQSSKEYEYEKRFDAIAAEAFYKLKDRTYIRDKWKKKPKMVIEAAEILSEEGLRRIVSDK